MDAIYSSLLRRIVDLVAWPCGIAYMVLCAIAVATLRDMSVLSASPACVRIDEVMIPLWYCAGALLGFFANLANAAILLTVWLPALLMTGVVDPATVQIAMPLVIFHALGLAATLFVVVRGCEWGIGGLLRWLRRGHPPVSPARF